MKDKKPQLKPHEPDGFYNNYSWVSDFVDMSRRYIRSLEDLYHYEKLDRKRTERYLRLTRLLFILTISFWGVLIVLLLILLFK